MILVLCKNYKAFSRGFCQVAEIKRFWYYAKIARGVQAMQSVRSANVHYNRYACVCGVRGEEGERTTHQLRECFADELWGISKRPSRNPYTWWSWYDGIL